MAYRVAILGIYHESNTFVHTTTTFADFRNGHLMKGAAIAAGYATAHHEIGGMLEVLDKEGMEALPVFYAEATPGGIIEADTYRQLLNEMMEELQKVLPVDACLVVPHGAAVSEHFPDMDGHWLSTVRSLVGNEVPVVGTLDPHANVSRQMIEATNALISYRTNPHVDQRRTGMEAASLLVRILRKAVNTCQELVQLPLAISIEQQYTLKEPCRSLYELVALMREEEQVLSISVNLGFPYADVMEMGTSLIIVTDNSPSVAQQCGKRLRSHIQKRQDSFTGELCDAHAAIASVAYSQRPVLMLDMGDNVGGGAPGNSTVILDVLENQSDYNGFICIYDPEAVAQALQFKVGDGFALAVRNSFEEKKEYRVTLIKCGDGRFYEDKPRHGGQVHFDMGTIAIVRTKKGNTILLTSLRVSPFSLNQLLHFGIIPEQFDIIVAKGVNAPVAAYSAVCPTIIQVNTPGVTQADMTKLTHVNRRKPMFPFERVEWPLNDCL